MLNLYEGNCLAQLTVNSIDFLGYFPPGGLKTTGWTWARPSTSVSRLLHNIVLSVGAAL